MKQVKLTKYIKWIYLLEGFLCFAFFYLSKGLIFQGVDGYQYVTELYSSGSDDDVAIFVMGLVCVLTSIFLLFKKSIVYHNVIVAISLALQLFTLILIEMGSIYLTLIVDNNLYLIGAVLAQTTAILILIRENVEYSSQQQV